MHKNHKIIICFVGFTIFIITFYFNLNFEKITSECVSIVSFSLAIYTICISNLIGSPLLERLRSTEHNEDRNCTQLGILKKYILYALYTAVITLVLACVCKLDFITNAMADRIFQAICFSLFSLNFAFIIIIFGFIINKQLR